MKKTTLAIAVSTIAVSGAAFAQDFEVDAYLGAEIGGNLLLDDQAGEDKDFAASNMVKFGAEMSTEVQEGIDGFVGAEVRYGVEGIDEDWTDAKYDGERTDINRFVVGADTEFGRTEFGMMDGVADTFDGFADLSMEHGLNAEFGSAIDGENTLQHTMTADQFTAGASYDFETEAVAIGGTFQATPELVLGASYVDGGEEEYEVGKVLDKSYSLGAVYSLEKIDVAAKYVSHEDEGADALDGYAIGAAYALNAKTSLAATYNSEEMVNGDDDDFITLGASYQLNENVELVSEWKATSEADDQLFVRANIDF